MFDLWSCSFDLPIERILVEYSANILYEKMYIYRSKWSKFSYGKDICNY